MLINIDLNSEEKRKPEKTNKQKPEKKMKEEKKKGLKIELLKEVKSKIFVTKETFYDKKFFVLHGSLIQVMSTQKGDIEQIARDLRIKMAREIMSKYAKKPKPVY